LTEKPPLLSGRKVAQAFVAGDMFEAVRIG
jgi:hypothetical protein